MTLTAIVSATREGAHEPSNLNRPLPIVPMGRWRNIPRAFSRTVGKIFLGRVLLHRGGNCV
jgi:hypothetical protein